MMTTRIWNSAWLLLVLTNIFWASNIITGRALLEHVPAVALSFWRWTGAFAVAFWFAWPYLKQDWRVLLAHWKLMLTLAAAGIAFFNTAAYLGLAETTAINALLLQSCMPLIVAVWALLLFGEKPTLFGCGGILLSLAGVTAIASHGSLDVLLGSRFFRGDLWILAAAAIYGIYVVLLRKRPDVHPLSFMLVAMGLGALMVAPFYLWEVTHGLRMRVHSGDIAGIAYMAVFPSFIAYLFFNRAVQLIGGTRAGHSTHLMPMFGGVMAMLFLGETLRSYHVAGAVLIGAGLLLAHLGDVRRGEKGRAGAGDRAAPHLTGPRRPDQVLNLSPAVQE